MNITDGLQQSLRDQFLNILSSSGENVHHSVKINTENVILFGKQKQQYFRKRWSRFATGAVFPFIHLDNAIKFVIPFLKRREGEESMMERKIVKKESSWVNIRTM